MSVVKLPRYHSVSRMQRQVVDALKTRGEPLYVVHTAHSADLFENEERCPVCYDDIYDQATQSEDCPICFGTGIKNGIRNVGLVYGIVTDNTDDEEITRRGEFLPNRAQATVDGLVDLYQNDFIIRSDHWIDDVPQDPLEAYTVAKVTKTTMRDGMRRGDRTDDILQQVVRLSLLPETHPIYNWTPPPTVYEESYRPNTPRRTV